jgi:hypothetical protein
MLLYSNNLYLWKIRAGVPVVTTRTNPLAAKPERGLSLLAAVGILSPVPRLRPQGGEHLRNPLISPRVHFSPAVVSAEMKILPPRLSFVEH